MQLNFFSGKGFEIKYVDYFYIYPPGGLMHVFGEFCELLDIFKQPHVHIFNKKSEPYILYFTPVLSDDNINLASSKKEAIKFIIKDDHYCGTSKKIIKQLNIKAGPPTRTGSKSSGHFLNYTMINFLGRDCAVIDLRDIDGWSLK